MSAPSTSVVGSKTPSEAKVALALGALSLVGLVFPPAIASGIAGLILGWKARGRIADAPDQFRGAWMAYLALFLSAVGTLASLVLPGFVVSVWIYAAFHGGQLPGGAP
jgi:hypothetical protein